jgi:hypothetical protein
MALIMSALSFPTTPTEIRPLLHAEIDRLGDEDVAVLHRIALELELEAVTRRLDDAFDEARAAGKLERLPEIIREARAAIRARKAS